MNRTLGLAVLLAAIALPAAHAANTPTMQKIPVAPAPKDPRIAELDAQIKTLKEQYHSQLDPLQEQVKALKGKFDPQISSLEDQRRDLVEAAKPPRIRELDEQEAAELKQLGDEEKTELDKVRQRFADERKQVQEKYKEKRQDLAYRKP